MKLYRQKPITVEVTEEVEGDVTERGYVIRFGNGLSEFVHYDDFEARFEPVLQH